MRLYNTGDIASSGFMVLGLEKSLEIIKQIPLAFIGGSPIGFERQWRQRMAGLRTNTLAATG